MFDCSNYIRQFHDDDVKLHDDEKQVLRDCRNTNRDRLKSALEKDKKPAPLRFQKQGSYAMLTTIQHPDNDYDIDDGVVFKKDDLKSERGSDIQALDVRKMVCSLLKDNRFNKQPEVLTNCVRVYYNNGHHVDIPVYREYQDGIVTKCEIASSSWRESDPKQINNWFQGQLDKKTIEDDKNDPQMRRMIRLLKKFANSRASWNLPNGFILTVLVDEVYIGHVERDDECFSRIIDLMHSRLLSNLEVNNPAQSTEVITKPYPDPKMELLCDKLNWAHDELIVLSENDCTKKKALKAWANVFNTPFWDDLIMESGVKSIVSSGGLPTAAVHKSGGGTYG